MTRPTFRDAYLVDGPSGGQPVGVVRRERHIWKILRFGVPASEQPSEAFATRERAGRRLLELAGERSS